MAKDIFSREAGIGQPYKAENSALILPGADDVLVVQNLNVQYLQQVSRIWEIGSNNSYFIGGRTQGNLQMGSVVGPKAINSALIERLGDVCTMTNFGESNTVGFQMDNPCSNTDVANLACVGCVLTSIGFRVASADMVVSQDMALMFAFLELHQTGAN